MLGNIFLGDLVLGFILFAFILSVVFITKKFRNPWVNRKIIHLSSAPAALAYMFVFKEPYVFFGLSILFTIMLIIPHIRKREFDWFQLRRNYGEVFYTLSFSVLAITMWNVSRILAGVSMLFMAIGDSVTGLVRSRFLKERAKHISGSIAMLIVCSVIGYYFMQIRGILLAVLATIAEYQPWVDDNLSIPLVTALAGLLLGFPTLT